MLTIAIAVQNHVKIGIRTAAHIIFNSWLNSCDPRVKFPALRLMWPRLESCVSVAAFLLKRMSSAMVIFHPVFRQIEYDLGVVGIFFLQDKTQRELGMFKDR